MKYGQRRRSKTRSELPNATLPKAQRMLDLPVVKNTTDRLNPLTNALFHELGRIQNPKGDHRG